jgi:DNA-binding SARP family transcriptional activator
VVTLSVRLFGKPAIERAGQALEGLHANKAQVLFCYLLLHRNRAHSRDSLATLLWSESPTSTSKKYLRQAFWQLQLAFQSDISSGPGRLLITDGDSVRLDPGLSLWLDVDVFERAAARVQGKTGEQLMPNDAAVLDEAVSLYTGDLLEGWYQDWCLCERERLQSTFILLLDKLMASAEATADYEKGMAYGEQILRHDRAREKTYQRMMRLQCLAGDRAGAIRQFQRCVSALDQELGVRPSKQTLEVYELIRGDHLQSIPSAAAFGNGADSGIDDAGRRSQSLQRGRAVGPLVRLRQLRSLLVSVQSRITQDIRAVDRALGARSFAHQRNRIADPGNDRD